MKELNNAVKRTVQSEKSLKIREIHNTSVFNVDKDANKKDIKDAVEKYFNVKVDDVNTVIT